MMSWGFAIPIKSVSFLSGSVDLLERSDLAKDKRHAPNRTNRDTLVSAIYTSAAVH